MYVLQVLLNTQLTTRNNTAMNCLIVSDCSTTRQRLTETLGGYNWNVTVLRDGVTAVTEYHRTTFVGFGVVFISLQMANMGGELTTRALVRMGCTVPIFVVAADPDSVDAVGLGAMGAVSLPLQVADLVELFLFSYRRRSNIGLEAQVESQDTQVVSRDVILLYYCMRHDQILLLYRL